MEKYEGKVSIDVNLLYFLILDKTKEHRKKKKHTSNHNISDKMQTIRNRTEWSTIGRNNDF